MRIPIKTFYGKLFKKRYTKHEQILLDLYNKGKVLEVEDNKKKKELNSKKGE